MTERTLDCNNITSDQEDEDPQELHIPKSEGDCVVKGPELETPDYAQPLKINKVNIGTKENPKFANIGDY